MSQTPGQDAQAAEHEPIRPEATRVHAQALGTQAGQQILQMAGVIKLCGMLAHIDVHPCALHGAGQHQSGEASTLDNIPSGISL